jgi:hypothetical protein
MGNLLNNGDFSDGPATSVVMVGRGDSAHPVGLAPGWSVWNNGGGAVTGDALWTSAAVQCLAEINIVGVAADVVAAFKSGPGGNAHARVVEVRTNAQSCGPYQFFSPAVPGAQSQVWVYVVEGGVYAELAYQGKAITGEGSTMLRQWEQIEIDSGACMTNEFVAYSSRIGSAWFYVAQVLVKANI